MYLFPLIVFYNPDSISNIWALVDVTSQFIAAIDTNNEPSMFFTLAQIMSLSFTIVAKYCTILILIPLVYLNTFLTSV